MAAAGSESVLETPSRRMDSLARCLEDGQECVAVVCINGQLLVAANGFRVGPDGAIAGAGSKASIPFIKAILQYFAAAARGDASLVAAKHKAVFSDCVFTKSRLQKVLKTSISDAVYEGAVERAYAGQDITRRELIDVHGHNLLTTAGIYYEAIDLHEGFAKIEQGLLDGVSADKFTAEQIEAFRRCESLEPKDYILHAEPKKGVHAEMQILGHVLKEIAARKIKRGAQIHIGISKSCCHNCHIMLAAAEEILIRHDITITHRGDHDVSFESKWQQSTLVQATELGKEIIRLYEKKKAEIPAQAGRLMGHGDASDSDAEASAEEKVKSITKELIRARSIFVDCPEQGDAIVKNLAIVECGLDLCKLDEFRDLFNIRNTTTEEQILPLTDVLIDHLKQSEFDLKLVKNFLESKFFVVPQKEKILKELIPKIDSLLSERARPAGSGEQPDGLDPSSKRKHEQHSTFLGVGGAYAAAAASSESLAGTAARSSKRAAPAAPRAKPEDAAAAPPRDIPDGPG